MRLPRRRNLSIGSHNTLFIFFLIIMNYDDPLADIDRESEELSKSKGEESQPKKQQSEPEKEEDFGSSPSSPASQPSSHGNDDRSYADEIYSRKISAKFRTFFIDLKQSKNGKFIKISEKSRGGQKSTIMMDSEDIPEFIAALQEVQGKI